MSSFFLAYLIRGLLKILLLTCKIRIEGLETFNEAAARDPCILMLWHNRLLILGQILAKHTHKHIYSAFVSKSRDGEILAHFVNSFRRGRSIRVAHNAKDRALRALIQELKAKASIAIVTPDGPRGPKYEIKQGIVKAAMAAEAKTVPCTWSVNKFWQLNTWDQLIIPKPFSEIVVRFGHPLTAGPAFENTMLHFKERLDALTTEVCQSVNPQPQHWPS